jgi:hypothetical protein
VPSRVTTAYSLELRYFLLRLDEVPAVYGRDSGPQLKKRISLVLEGISEAQVARHGLPVGLMVRMKASVRTWRQAAS